MSSPVFGAMGGNMQNMSANNPFKIVQDFIQFKKTFKGNPQEEVQKLLQSGQLSQGQLNQIQGMAGQFQGLINQFMNAK